jgi:hypothetical protein
MTTGTKNNPGVHDCYARAEPDEPMFHLLARDKHGPALVWLWAVLRELDGESAEVVADARERVVSMMCWAHDHGRQPVGNGQAVLAGVLELIRCANYAVEKEAANAPTGVDFVRMILCKTTFEQTAPPTT